MNTPKRSKLWPELITIEKQDDIFSSPESTDKTQDTKKETFNTLIQSKQFLAWKLWITPEEEKRILELVHENDLKTIENHEIIQALEADGISSSKIILTLLVQYDPACLMTIEWLLQKNLIKKLDEQTFVAMLDFPFGVQLIHDIFRGKSLKALMEDQRKILEENKEVSRAVLKQEYNHSFIDLDTDSSTSPQTIPLIDRDIQKEYTPNLFENLGTSAVAALLERWMNEALRVWLEKNMFMIDDQIIPYLLKLKSLPSFQEASEQALQNFESQLKSVTKEMIEPRHDGVMDGMIWETFWKIQKNIAVAWKAIWNNFTWENIKEHYSNYYWEGNEALITLVGVRIIIPVIILLYLNFTHTITDTKIILLSILVLFAHALKIPFKFSYKAIKTIPEIQSKDTIAKLKRREIRKNDRSVALSEIDSIANNLLPGSLEYKQLMNFKHAIESLDTPWSQVSVSPSTIKLYQETPTLFFKRTITPSTDWVHKLGGIIADHMNETEDYLSIMQWQISSQKDGIKNNNLAESIKKVAQQKLSVLLFSEIDNINTVWQFETLYIGNANALAEKYYAITPHSWLPSYLKYNSEFKNNNEFKKKFKTMVNRIIKNTTTHSELEALVSCHSLRNKFKADTIYNYNDTFTYKKIIEIKETLIKKAEKICEEDPECDINTYNTLRKLIKNI